MYLNYFLGNLPFKIFCASASSRNTGNQDPQEERLREEVNRYMKQKIDEVNSQGIFDYSEPIGIHRFYAYLVGERNLMDVNFGKSSIKVIVKCRTVEILEGLWRDYCCGHLNVVAEECLITETVKEELCMETIKLKTTILEEDYVACKLSLMEIPGILDVVFNCYNGVLFVLFCFVFVFFFCDPNSYQWRCHLIIA